MEGRENRSHVLTEEQKTFLDENFGKLKEKDLFQKLSEIGPKTDEKTFAEYLSGLASEIEADVFQQNVSEEELEGTSGGQNESNGTVGEPYYFRCEKSHHRYIYKGGFPNCATTVEDGSWCWSADACYLDDINYQEMKRCTKAWE